VLWLVALSLHKIWDCKLSFLTVVGYHGNRLFGFPLIRNTHWLEVTSLVQSIFRWIYIGFLITCGSCLAVRPTAIMIGWELGLMLIDIARFSRLDQSELQR
jgi:hypothetical protein